MRSVNAMAVSLTILGGAGVARAQEAAAQKPTPDGSKLLALKATMAARDFDRTEPIPLEVEAKNLTRDSIVYHAGLAEHAAFTLDVTDESNSKVPNTRYGDLARDGFGSTNRIGSGETKKYKIYINTLRDMSLPLTYEIRIKMNFFANSERHQPFETMAKPVKVKVVEKGAEAEKDECGRNRTRASRSRKIGRNRGEGDSDARPSHPRPGLS